MLIYVPRPGRGFFMYLKALYRHNKFWFLVVVMFAAGQLFFNYKQGIECSPFYHYNMFSGDYHFILKYAVTEVTIKGKALQPEHFSPNGWDNIVMPVGLYRSAAAGNSYLYNETISRLLPVKDSTLYTNTLTETGFDNWYKLRLMRLLHLPDTAGIRYRIAYYPTGYLLSR